MNNLPFKGNIADKSLPKIFHTDTKVEVLMPIKNEKTKEIEYLWVKGTTLESKLSPDPKEDFLRINVLLDNGKEVHFAHPDCVRIQSNQLKLF